MASGDLDVPQIALLVGMPDTTGSDDLFSPALSRSSSLLDSSRIPPSSDNHNSSCPPTLVPTPGPVLRPVRNSLGSIRWATSTALSDNNHEKRNESSSYASNHRNRRRRSDMVTGTEQGTRNSMDSEPADRRFKLLSRAAHSDGTRHDASLDAGKLAGTSAGSRPSFVTSLFRRTVRRVRRPSGDLDAGSDEGSHTARNGGQKGVNVNVRRKGTQLARPQARPVALDLIHLKQDLKSQQFFDLGFFQKQSIMENLEERLEATKKLHREAVDLQMFYESGTAAIMRDLRATVLPRPLPEDDAVFNEVDFLLAEIGRFYEELNKFWKEEILHVAKALKEGRTDPRDLEGWNDFHPSLNQTIEFWKKKPPESDAQPLRSNDASSSTGVDLGEKAAPYHPQWALSKMPSSACLRAPRYNILSLAGLPSSESTSDLRETVTSAFLSYGTVSIGLPTSSHAGASHYPGERSTGLRSEVTGVSARRLETFESVGGGGALLHRRTHPTHVLSAGTPPARHASPDEALLGFTVSHAADKNPPTPDIMITPPASEPVEDTEQILGRDILLQHPNQILLQLRRLTLQDKVLVLLSIYAIVSLSLSLFN